VFAIAAEGGARFLICIGFFKREQGGHVLARTCYVTVHGIAEVDEAWIAELLFAFEGVARLFLMYE
jgi:hypothetical protein